MDYGYSTIVHFFQPLFYRVILSPIAAQSNGYIDLAGCIGLVMDLVRIDFHQIHQVFQGVWLAHVIGDFSNRAGFTGITGGDVFNTYTL